MNKHCRTMGEAVDAAVNQSSEEWFRRHRGLRSREEALVTDVKMVTATCERRPGGFLRIHVGIVTSDRNTTITDMYDYQLVDKHRYVPKGSSNGKG